MKLERSYNTKRNIVMGELDKFVGILLPFLVRTMIIHLMAAEYLGLMSLYYSIVQMLNLAELGFGTAIVYSMYQPIASNNARKINALLKFYARAYRLVGVIVGVIGLCILPFLPHMISGEVPSDINIYLLYLIFLGNTCLNYFIFPERKALMTAYQRDDLIVRMHVPTQLGMYAVQILAVWLARDFYLYAITIPIATVGFNVLCAKQVNRYFPEYRVEGTLEDDEFREIRRQVAGLTVRKLATLSRNAFDSMFVSAFLGLSITAIYGNYYYIMDAIVMILAVLKTSMAGGVGNSIAMDSVEKNLRDMNTINFLYMWLGGWCAICLLCLYQPFMELWVGSTMLFETGVAVMFAVYFYVLKMGDIRTLYAEAVGIWWQARYLSIAEAAANLILNYVLVQLLGVYGIILATLLSYLVFNFIGGAVVLFRHYFKDGGFGRYLWSNGIYLIVTGLIGAVTYFCTSRIPFGGWPGLILQGVLCIVIPGVLYLIIYSRSREFKNAKPFLQVLLRRRKH